MPSPPRTRWARKAMDAASEAKRIAFDRTGHGETVLLLSGFPQTRRSWNKVVPLLSRNSMTVTADLPSFGDSGIPDRPGDDRKCRAHFP